MKKRLPPKKLTIMDWFALLPRDTEIVFQSKEKMERYLRKNFSELAGEDDFPGHASINFVDLTWYQGGHRRAAILATDLGSMVRAMAERAKMLGIVK